MDRRSPLWLALILALACIQISSPLRAQQPPRARTKRTATSAHERPSCRQVAEPAGLRRRQADSANLTAQSSSAPAQQTLGEQPPAPSKATDTSERLQQLRQLLLSNNYNAYLVTPNDEHGSEYVADYDRRLRFISGFSGSNGYALVTLDRAVLFTDGRYALQAELDLDCNWALVVSGNPIKDIPAWVRAHSAQRQDGLRLATDARLMSLQVYDYLESELKKQEPAFEFKLISIDLVDVVWNTVDQLHDKRPAPGLVVHQLPAELGAQTSWQDKTLRLADLMARHRARYYVISKLDDIAWLLNLRGSDVPMAPLFKAYLLVSRLPTGQAQSGPRANRLADGAAAEPGRPAGSAPSGAAMSGPSAQMTLEQLLAGAGSGAQLQQQQTAGDQLPSLQTPQVVQVPASQLIKLTLYVDLRKVTPQVREHLRLLEPFQQPANSSGPAAPTSAEHLANVESRIQVELKNYDVFIADFGERFRLQAAAGQADRAALADGLAAESGHRLLLDAAANVAIHVLVKNYDDRLILVEPLCQRLKSVKTEAEVAGMRHAHWRDSLAIAMLLGQLEQDIGVRKLTDKWTEVGAADELEFYRSLMDHNRGQSFDTISAYGANGAIIHYRPDPLADHQVRIGNQSTYLLDSGGQYLDGTTDITRTVHFGQPSDLQRETYTRVLMGAIDMMSLIFELPSERAPHRINDLLARRHLFDMGLNYEHGTGHGIGLYSLVHESPALIANYDDAVRTSSKGSQSKMVASAAVHDEPLSIRENMFSSVEPGFYKRGEFGIRLENIVVTQRLAWATDERRRPAAANGSEDAASSAWLRFEPVSLVPFEPKLMKLELLSNQQKAWLNSYNLLVRFTMTQQINHYLERARQQQQAQPGPSSARLYKRLQEGNASADANSSLFLPAQEPRAQPNFMRASPGKLRHLLEQAHRWIMSKTELIPLDVPRRLSGAPAARLDGRAAERAPPRLAGPSSATNEPADGEQAQPTDEWLAMSAHPTGRRLMFAYMAGLPFNDASAARLLATPLAGRAGGEVAGPLAWPKSDSDNSDGAPAVKSNNSSQPPAGSLGRQKCAGIECDLLLLEALNAHQRLTAGSAGSQQLDAGAKSQSDSRDAPEQQEKAARHQLLLDLFQIRPTSLPDAASGLWRFVANMWPILGLALVITLQLAVVIYVCGGRKKCPRQGRARGAAVSAGASPLRSPSMSWVLSSGSGRSSCGPAADAVDCAASLDHPQRPQLSAVITENI